MSRRFIASMVLFVLLSQMRIPVHAQDVLRLPSPGQMVSLSARFKPLVLRGMQVHPDNPFRFNFLVDSGDTHLTGDGVKAESAKLIKYFLVCLTTPEEDLWVNLSPYEKDRIVPESFGQTEMGRDLLAQDYFLKQITASLIYPESQLGKVFWKEVYAKAQAKFGTTAIPINTFNKVWIVPDKVVVYENEGKAFVLTNHLKVMLEEDYLAKKSDSSISSTFKKSLDEKASRDDLKSSTISSLIREVIIPALEIEVNEGKNFAQLRQVFYALSLATWYKKKIKDSILNKVYANKNKIQGLISDEATDVETIYQQYLLAFKKGVYNYVKEVYDSSTQETIPRKYFAGGIVGRFVPEVVNYIGPKQISRQDEAMIVSSGITNIGGNLRFLKQHAGLDQRMLPKGVQKEGANTELLKNRYDDQAMSTPWKASKLFGFDELKQEVDEVMSQKKYNSWRFEASLASLSNNDWRKLQDWVRLKRMNSKRLEAYRSNGSRLMLYYSPAMELEDDLANDWRKIPLFYETEHTSHQRWIEQHDDLWQNVLKIAGNYQLGAHGTLNSYNQSHFMSVTPLNLHWAMLSIMLKGRVQYGERGRLASINDSYGDLAFNAASFGSYYVIFDSPSNTNFRKNPSKEEDHLIYLVPEENARAFFEVGLKKAVGYGFITEKQADIVRSKILTYEEFVSIQKHIPEIKMGNSPRSFLRNLDDGKRNLSDKNDQTMNSDDRAMLGANRPVLTVEEIEKVFMRQLKGKSNDGIQLPWENSLAYQDNILAHASRGWSKSFLERIMAEIKVNPLTYVGTIALMGEGTGNQAIETADYLPEAKIVVIDFEPSLVSAAFMHIQKSRPQLLSRMSFILADARDLQHHVYARHDPLNIVKNHQIPDQSFDIVNFQGMIELSDWQPAFKTEGKDVIRQKDQQAMMAEAKRLLKIDGIIAALAIDGSLAGAANLLDSDSDFKVLVKYFWNDIFIYQKQYQDQAQLIDAKGGIDFNLSKFNMEIQHQSKDFKFNIDTKTLDNMRIEGAEFVIVNVASMTNLPSFLGLPEK